MSTVEGPGAQGHAYSSTAVRPQARAKTAWRDSGGHLGVADQRSRDGDQRELDEGGAPATTPILNISDHARLAQETGQKQGAPVNDQQGDGMVTSWGGLGLGSKWVRVQRNENCSQQASLAWHHRNYRSV